MSRADAPIPAVRAELGVRAEALATDYLARQGLEIVARNFRTRRGEIDVIVRDRDTLVFVEVRLRSRAAYGGAAASITPAKRARLLAAAQAYLATLAREPACRFDAILLDGLDPARIAWERNILEE
jgi:putative endonuclease